MIAMIGTSKVRPTEDENLPKRIRSEGLGFSEADMQGIQYPYDDALVVSLSMNNYDVHRVLVDSGSSVNILYFDAFVRMDLRMEDLRLVDSTLIGFIGDTIIPKGVITLIFG